MAVLVDGYTIMHEHITIDLSGVKKDMDCRLDCMEETVQELKELYQFGVRNIVDVTNAGMGQNVAYVTEVAKQSGINIIQSTGYYKEPFLPQKVYDQTVEELAQGMTKEIIEGFQGSSTKAEMIGEMGTSNGVMMPMEEKVLNAGILAHKITGKPIYTHTTLGTYAKEQAKYFQDNGVNLKKVIIGHIDLSGKLEYIKEVIQYGVTVGFDTIGKNNYFPDTERVNFLMELEKEGLLDHVVLSMDLTRKSNLRSRGGLGYSYLFEKFIPMLRTAGMKEESIRRMLIDNPKKIFT